ncbi:unnamed protein product, partial [marine sediment metagenome]
MKKRAKICLIIGFISFVFIFQYYSKESIYNYQDQNEFEVSKLSSSTEGVENILITEVSRRTNLSAYGLINSIDKLTILNENDNPIHSILMGVPLKDSNKLIYISAKSHTENTLIAERSYGV